MGSRDSIGREGELPADVVSYYPRLRRVRDHVKRNLAGDVSLDAAAAIAGMEKNYFSRFFHEKTGVRYYDWVAELRVLRAMELMRQEDREIVRIAHAAGFKHVRTFERTFKRITSMTPREFRAKVKPHAEARRPVVSSRSRPGIGKQEKP